MHLRRSASPLGDRRGAWLGPVDRPEVPADLQRTISPGKLGSGELLVALAVLFAGFLLRVWDLASIPPGLLYDEAYNTRDVAAVLGGAITPFFSGNYGREALFIYLQAAAVALFGPTSFSLRLVSAAIGTLTLASAYILARRLLGPRIAVLAAAGLAVSLWHVMFSRIGLRAVSLPLFEGLALYCLWRGLEPFLRPVPQGGRQSPQWRWHLLAGLFLGLSLYTYTAARFLPLVPLLFGISLALMQRRHARGILTGTAAVLVVAALVGVPLGGYFLLHPQDFTERASQVSVLSDSGSYGGPLGSIWYSLSRTAGAFVTEGDRSWDRNISGHPIFDPVWLVLFTAGLVVAICKWRQPAHGLIMVTAAVMILPHMLTVASLPNYLRLVGILPVLYACTAVGLDAITAWAARWRPGWRPFITGTVVVILVLSAVRTGYDYFLDWGVSPDVSRAFEDNRVRAVRFLLEQAAAGYSGATYISVPLGSAETIDTEISPYTLPRDLRPLLDQLRPFDGRVCLVLPPEGQTEALYAVPPGAPVPAVVVDKAFGPGAAGADREGFRTLAPSQMPTATGRQAAFAFGDAVVLQGFDLPSDVQAGEAITPTLYWRITETGGEPLRLGVHIVDARQQAVAKEDSDGLALALRLPEERIISYMSPLLPTDLPTGSYRVLLTVYNVRDMSRLPVRDTSGKTIGEWLLLGPFKVRGQGDRDQPAMPSGATFGEGIRLRGYDVDRQTTGGADSLRVRLHWESAGQPDRDYTVFVHLEGSDGKMLGQHDGPPRGGGFPTSMWEVGDAIADDHVVDIEGGPQAGDLRLAVGIYDPQTGERLPVRNAAGQVQPDRQLLLEVPVK